MTPLEKEMLAVLKAVDNSGLLESLSYLDDDDEPPVVGPLIKRIKAVIKTASTAKPATPP
jgi:hypothetical protein